MEASERHFFHSKSPFISLSFSLSLSLSPCLRQWKVQQEGKDFGMEGRGQLSVGVGVERVLLCQHCDIFPKMHIVSIQIGDVFIGVHRKLHKRREVCQAFWPRPLRLRGWSSWLVKLLFFRCKLAGKHISSQAATQCSPSQYGCHAEEPIEGKDSPP